MKLINITCNHCGAPLEVPPETRFLTCAFCNARLQIQRSGSAVYTDVLDAIGEHTAQLANSMETIKWQNELERLDRDWKNERREFVTIHENGSMTEPVIDDEAMRIGMSITKGMKWVVCVTWVVFVVVQFGMESPFIAIAGSLIGVFVGFYWNVIPEATLTVSRDYYGRKNRYEERRRELIRLIKSGT